MIRLRRVWRCLQACVALLWLGACSDVHDANESTVASSAVNSAVVQGKVTYRERMLLPPEAVVEVQLQDISRADAMAEVLATVQIYPQGGPPFDFSIEYNPAEIDSRMTYALRATISVGDELLFTSTDYIDPFDASPVEAMVEAVPGRVSRP